MKSQILLAIFLTTLTLNSACSRHEPNIVSASSETVSDTKSATVDARIQKAETLIEKMPEAAQGYNNLAVAYIQIARETGDFGLNSKAEAAINRAAEIEPQNPTAQKLKASLHLTMHRFAEGLEAGKNLQKSFPKDAFVYGVLTDANVELGNYKEAVEAGQTMVDLRPNMESYARVAHLRSLHGDTDGAIEALAMAARIADPQDREAQSWCLTFLGHEYFKIGKFAEAEKQYDAALQILPNYHLAVAGKSKTRAAQDDFENAVKLYTDAQNRVPLVETVIELGDLYAHRGDVEKALQQYELAEVIEQKFGNTDLRRLALLWADRDVRLDEAVNIAAREHQNRKDIFTADIYAWTLYKTGKFQEAKVAINEALRLKTKDARIFYHAGMIEKGLGNRAAAKRYLQLAIETNPAFDILQADKARTVLQELN